MLHWPAAFSPTVLRYWCPQAFDRVESMIPPSSPADGGRDYISQYNKEMETELCTYLIWIIHNDHSLFSLLPNESCQKDVWVPNGEVRNYPNLISEVRNIRPKLSCFNFDLQYCIFRYYLTSYSHPIDHIRYFIRSSKSQSQCRFRATSYE